MQCIAIVDSKDCNSTICQNSLFFFNYRAHFWLPIFVLHLDWCNSANLQACDCQSYFSTPFMQCSSVENRFLILKRMAQVCTHNSWDFDRKHAAKFWENQVLCFNIFGGICSWTKGQVWHFSICQSSIRKEEDCIFGREKNSQTGEISQACCEDCSFTWPLRRTVNHCLDYYKCAPFHGISV